MARFGETDSSSYSGGQPSDNVWHGTKFTLSESGTIYSLKFFTRVYTGYGASWKGAIFADNAGVPSTLLGVTEPRYLDSENYSWQTLKFNTPVVLSAGDYWLAILPDPDVVVPPYYAYKTYGGRTDLQFVAGTYATPSDYSSTSYNGAGTEVVIFAVYLTSAPGTGIENFSTGWEETDLNSHLAQTSTRSTWAGINYNEDCWLERIAPVALSDDWDINFKFMVDSASSVQDNYGIEAFELSTDDEAYILYIELGKCSTGNGLRIGVGFGDFVNDYWDGDGSSGLLSVDTVYYARFKRWSMFYTESAHLDVYANITDLQNEDNPVLQIIIPLGDALTGYGVMGQTFTTIICPGSYDNDDSSTDFYGYIEDLNLVYATQFPLAVYEADGSGGTNYNYTFSFEMTIPDEANMILIVGVGVHGGTTNIIGNIKWNGTDLTELGMGSALGGEQGIWYLLDPEPGTYNIVVTKDDTYNARVAAAAIVLSGVTQEAPHAWNFADGTNPATDPNVDITTTAPNQIIIDSYCIQAGNELATYWDQMLVNYNQQAAICVAMYGRWATAINTYTKAVTIATGSTRYWSLCGCAVTPLLTEAPGGPISSGPFPVFRYV
jgi:hypothetical protein